MAKLTHQSRCVMWPSGNLIIENKPVEQNFPEAFGAEKQIYPSSPLELVVDAEDVTI